MAIVGNSVTGRQVRPENDAAFSGLHGGSGADPGSWYRSQYGRLQPGGRVLAASTPSQRSATACLHPAWSAQGRQFQRLLISRVRSPARSEPFLFGPVRL